MKADFESPPPKVFRHIVITIESEEERELFHKAFIYILRSFGEDVSGKLYNDLRGIQQDFFS